MFVLSISVFDGQGEAAWTDGEVDCVDAEHRTVFTKNVKLLPWFFSEAKPI